MTAYNIYAMLHLQWFNEYEYVQYNNNNNNSISIAPNL